MSPAPLIFLALAMSTDTFAAVIDKGSSLDQPHLSEALRTRIIFGVIEAITPLIGWLLGQTASQFAADWDYQITFVLLVLLDLHMIHNGLCADHTTEQEKPGQRSSWILTVTVLVASIDALTMSVNLTFVDVNIFLAAGAIGLVIMTMVTFGTMLGRALDAVTGRRAEMVGRVVLILVGATILYKYLRAA